MPKAHEYRVSLTLNRNDPLHRTAISALEGQGRRKTQFVVNAITSYIMEGKGMEELMRPDRAYIEEICREVCQALLNKKPASAPQFRIPLEEDTNAEREMEESMEFVTDVLNSFRKQT